MLGSLLGVLLCNKFGDRLGVKLGDWVGFLVDSVLGCSVRTRLGDLLGNKVSEILGALLSMIGLTDATSVPGILGRILGEALGSSLLFAEGL